MKSGGLPGLGDIQVAVNVTELDDLSGRALEGVDDRVASGCHLAGGWLCGMPEAEDLGTESGVGGECIAKCVSQVAHRGG
jgi:hypothetical protein